MMQQQQFQQQLHQQQQPLLQNRDMNGSPMSGTPSPLHYNSQLPSQYNNVHDQNMNNNNRTSMHGAIHRVPVPHQPPQIQTQQLQYGSDIKHAPEMTYTGGYEAAPPQYVKA